MNFADLQQAAQLSTEKQIIERAIKILTTGGKITSMSLTGEMDDMPPIGGGGALAFGNSATVRTDYMTYPQQMVDTILGSFQSRLQEITAELATLGVTGL